MLGGHQPVPHRAAPRPAAPGRRAPRTRCQHRQLVGPSPRQQRPDQPVLAAEQEQQHAAGWNRWPRPAGAATARPGRVRARSGRRGRAARSGGPRGGGGGHRAILSLKQLFQWGVRGRWSMSREARDPAARAARRPGLGGPGPRGDLRGRVRLGPGARGAGRAHRGRLRRAADPTREAAWIAELDGRRVGCVFCVAADAETAQLRILLVDPAARGHGLGARLTRLCVDFARAAGYRRMRLWTNHPLAAARQIYLAAGFALVESDRHRSFGVDLVGQVYELDLVRAGQPVNSSSRARPSSSVQRCTCWRTRSMSFSGEGVRPVGGDPVDVDRAADARRGHPQGVQHPDRGDHPVVHVALGHPEVREQGTGLLGHRRPAADRVEPDLLVAPDEPVRVDVHDERGAVGVPGDQDVGGRGGPGCVSPGTCARTGRSGGAVPGPPAPARRVRRSGRRARPRRSR